MTLAAKIAKADLWRAIRAHCLACGGAGSTAQAATNVRRCNRLDCPLHPYRFGRAPRKGSRCPAHV
jgi:hypothetical protein